MIQLKLVLFGLTVAASIGLAVYSYYKSQEQQHTYGPHRSRSSGNNDFSPSAPDFATQSRCSRRKRIKKFSCCSICLEDTDEHDPSLKCGHAFHRHCIDRWFQNEKSCPNCRVSFP